MQPVLASWQLWALLSATFAALTAVLAKVGVAGVHPDVATLIRTVVILLLVAGIAAAGRHARPLDGLTARGLAALVLSGLATGASWLCYFRALRLGDAARVAPLDKLSVVLVAVLGTLLLGERLSAANWAGVALIAAGAVLVAWQA